MKIRYAKARIESVEKREGRTSADSPVASPSTSSVSPPPAIWTAAESSALPGSGTCRELNEPSAHVNAANTTRKKPIGLPTSVAPPGRSSSGTPPQTIAPPPNAPPGALAEADRHAHKRHDGHPLPGEAPHQDDPQRHRRDHERREARRDVLLG